MSPKIKYFFIKSYIYYIIFATYSKISKSFIYDYKLNNEI